MKRVKMELIDRGFSQKIVGKYTNLKLFSVNFTPIISTKRIIPRMKWLELVYALPYLVLRREILNSFKKTTNVLASAKRIWNIFLHLNFPLSCYKYFLSGAERETPAGIEKGLTLANYQLPVITTKPPTASYKPLAVSYKNQATHILSSTSDFITPLFSYYSVRPPTMFLLSQKTVPVMHRGESLSLQKSDTVYRPYVPQYASPEPAKVETEKELAVTNYQLPVVTHPLPTLSHKPMVVRNKSMRGTSIIPGTKELITTLFSYYSTHKIKADMGGKTIYDITPYFNLKHNKQMHLNTSWVEKAPLYHTYPEIEHVTSTHTEIIKQRVLEKEEESKLPHVIPQLPGIDLNRLTDQVYQMIERKVRIERERRGL